MHEFPSELPPSVRRSSQITSINIICAIYINNRSVFHISWSIYLYLALSIDDRLSLLLSRTRRRLVSSRVSRVVDLLVVYYSSSIISGYRLLYSSSHKNQARKTTLFICYPPTADKTTSSTVLHRNSQRLYFLVTVGDCDLRQEYIWRYRQYDEIPPAEIILLLKYYFILLPLLRIIIRPAERAFQQHNLQRLAVIASQQFVALLPSENISKGISFPTYF